MLFFHHIKNDHLKGLVMASESILSQDEKTAQQMINDIAMLPEDAQQQMIEMLENEQKEIAARLTVSPKSQFATLEDNNLKIASISHQFDKELRETEESGEQKTAEVAAEALINNI